MRNLFPGFYKRSEEELSKIWQEGVFVFDTNMLLNIYRYTQKTRARYLEILDLLKQRNQLWIPHQVAHEYQDRRMSIIQGQIDAYTEVTTILQSTAQKLEGTLGTYQNKHEFIHAGEIIEEVNSVIKKAKTTVTQSRARDKREYEALKKQDKLLEKLEELFQDNVGSAYTGEKQRELYKQAQERLELRIPPGWEDEDKRGYRRYGDIMLWFQLIDYARSQKKPIIFVTDDGKKDWWIRDSQGKPINPLPELIQEMFIEAGVLLHMYQGYNFIDVATQFFKLKAQPEIIKEAEKITEQNTLELYQVKYHAGTIARQGFQAEDAVLEWLKERYKRVFVNDRSDIGIDFILEDEEAEWIRVGIEVKYKIEQFRRIDIKDLLDKLNTQKNRKIQGFSSIILFLVCSNMNHAKSTLSDIKLYEIKRPSVSITVGYITSFGYFEEVGHFEEAE